MSALTLQRLAEGLRELEKAPEAVAKAAAPELKSLIVKQVAAVMGPDGSPWQLTKEGKQPLRHAAAAVSVEAAGTVITATVTGPEALHNIGAAKGHIKRQILPDAKSAAMVVDAVSRVVDPVIQKAFNG